MSHTYNPSSPCEGSGTTSGVVMLVIRSSILFSIITISVLLPLFPLPKDACTGVTPSLLDVQEEEKEEEEGNAAVSLSRAQRGFTV